MYKSVGSSSSHLTLHLLAWLSAGSRTYGETMDAWRTSCPRLSVWEDALQEGLVAIKRDGGPMSTAAVVVTKDGEALLRTEAA